MTVASHCPYCGAAVSSGLDGCMALYAEVQGRWLADPAGQAVALLGVDAHALQHPEIHGYKSNAFHLIRLCWILEFGGCPRIGQGPRWLQVHFDGKPQIPLLEAPGNRGTVTVADVAGAARPQEYAGRMRAWGQSVWQARSAYHEWARQSVRDMKGDGIR